MNHSAVYLKHCKWSIVQLKKIKQSWECLGGGEGRPAVHRISPGRCGTVPKSGARSRCGCWGQVARWCWTGPHGQWELGAVGAHSGPCLQTCNQAGWLRSIILIYFKLNLQAAEECCHLVSMPHESQGGQPHWEWFWVPGEGLPDWGGGSLGRGGDSQWHGPVPQSMS